MEYVKIDENLPDHPKVLSLPAEFRASAMWLFVRANCYCSRNLTDGFVPAGFFEGAGDDMMADELVRVGLFDSAENGYIVHDYLDYNRSKEQIAEYIEKRRTAGQKGGEASGKARAKQVLPGSFANRSSKTNPEADTDTKKELLSALTTEVIAHLNEKAGTSYRAASSKTRSAINARLNDGFRREDFFAVIDGRVAAWKNDAKMRQYLRPETLFGPKFEGYLNVPFEPTPEEKSEADRFFSRVTLGG